MTPKIYEYINRTNRTEVRTSLSKRKCWRGESVEEDRENAFIGNEIHTWNACRGGETSRQMPKAVES